MEAAVRDLGDVVVFIDSDFIDIGPHYVTGLVGPLLYELDVWFVKAFYNRPVITESGVRPTGGGGVTELVARPLLNLYWPQLASVMQPLAGEWRHLARSSGTPTVRLGVRMEVAMLVDPLRLVGLEGIAQVDLGWRDDSDQADTGLGLMAAAILQTALSRLPCSTVTSHFPTLAQFYRFDRQQVPIARPVKSRERPTALSFLITGGTAWKDRTR